VSRKAGVARMIVPNTLGQDISRCRRKAKSKAPAVCEEMPMSGFQMMKLLASTPDIA
jgi:hypothetical protein